MRVWNVLIFPAGTEIGLEIFRALKGCKEIRLFAAGQDISNHAQFIYSQYHVLPSIYEANWVEALVKLCDKLAIDYIFPAYDDIIVALSAVTERLPAQVIAPSAETCQITRSKLKTYALLDGVMRVPRIYENPADISQFPVFIKPDQGQGSFGAKRIDSLAELIAALGEHSGMIISEYLPGEEYTVDCFSDRSQGVLFAGARIRSRMRNGIAVNTKTVELPGARALAGRIGEKLALHGAWFFQLKRAADGMLALLEVAPRIAGSMAAHRVQGVNFPLLSIYEQERIPLRILNNNGTVEMDRALCNRYKHTIRFDVLYVDLDDTLIVNGEVNTEVVKFIYQCINDRKKIILLTKHAADVQCTLAACRLAAAVFDEIIQVPSAAQKSRYINTANAVLIDDSFSERLDVATSCGIATFDSSMLEVISKGTAA